MYQCYKCDNGCHRRFTNLLGHPQTMVEVSRAQAEQQMVHAIPCGVSLLQIKPYDDVRCCHCHLSRFHTIHLGARRLFETNRGTALGQSGDSRRRLLSESLRCRLNGEPDSAASAFRLTGRMSLVTTVTPVASG